MEVGDIMTIEEFDIIWNDGIEPEAKDIVDANEGTVEFYQESKMQVFDRYSEINQRCKRDFMHDTVGLLDRHKVSASMILAICQTRLLYNKQKKDSDGKEYVFNEILALKVGLQLLKGYLNNNKDQENIDEFYFPVTNNPTEKYEYFLCRLLRFDLAYNQASVLAIANILYFIENYTYQHIKLLECYRKLETSKDER